jgi:hypothetical protein
MAEDEREFINSHPAVVVARERIEDRQRREREARERWREEYDRRMRIWVAGGGAESEFVAA